MAATAVLPAMNGYDEKSVHPFFRPGGRVNGYKETVEAPEHSVHNAEDGEDADISQLDGVADAKPKAKRTRKAKAQDGKKQKTLQELVNPKAKESEIAAGPSNGHVQQDVVNLCTSEPAEEGTAVDTPRRKRRRTSQFKSKDVGEEPKATTPPRRRFTRSEIANSTSDVPFTSSPRVVIPASSPLPKESVIEVHDTDHEADVLTTPTKKPAKKVLRLNANGKFSSPIKKPKDDAPPQASPGAPKRRGRPRKAKEAAEARRLVVVLPYSSDIIQQSELGDRINRILAGEERVPLPTKAKKPSPKKPRTPRKAKTTHPFFTGNPPKHVEVPKQESPRKTAATTPGKLKMQVLGEKMPAFRDVLPEVWTSTLGKDRFMVKHPGAREALWPGRGQVHVRGLEVDDEVGMVEQVMGRKRKSKSVKVPFPVEESILRRYAEVLVPEEDGMPRPDGFTDSHPSLRVPTRHLIPGHQIRERIAPELSTKFPDEDQDPLSLPTSSQLSCHPALKKLWDTIPTTLSAFDELRGETQTWAQKYAPSTAGEVLQPGKEMQVLKDWLVSLAVNTVEGAAAPSTKPAVKTEAKPRKKRRRKPEDLDDFLVDSDEDIHNMDELTDPEDTTPTCLVSRAVGQRSIVQVAADGIKLSNAVLLSGPHGCGKTGAAYAVAKELGFKVFEISSSERRSGRDVMEKVGDMTENHLVKHHGTTLVADAGELSSTEDEIKRKERLDEAFQRDLASGKQRGMASFFKPATATKPKAKVPAKPKPAVSQAKTMKAVEQALKAPKKDQQQSLILLEEVDVLFRDDKEFWTTVLKLIVTSRRPFIMTCNDESLVPTQAMNLHAILRFTPPPTDLAVDYLLLIAAAEGHLLERDAVTELYESKQRGLRTSIAELDFWCQMGVGDVRNGLGWIYQRWPPGSDVDERGRKLRVVSEGTFQSGMGVLPEGGLGEDDRMTWVWREHGVEPTDLLQLDVEEVEEAAVMCTEKRLTMLKRYGWRADTLSAMDAFTANGLPGTAPLDTMQPEMSDKQRQQYIEGLPLLQTDEQVDHAGLSMEMVAASVCALLRNDDPTQAVASPEQLQAAITAKFQPPTHPYLARSDFSVFDPISYDPSPTLPGLTLSAFDGPLSAITTDLAPYVRSIVQYDLALEEQRQRLAEVTGEGGRLAKRARTTRAARSALEGGQRSSTRRERWFKTKELDLLGVLRTGGEGWPRASLERPVSVEGGEVSTTDGAVDVMEIDGTEPPVLDVAPAESDVASGNALSREVSGGEDMNEIQYE